ncbi:myotubularin-related protein 12 [Leptodactylus fuscus]|uniref:myotubularin-related protein 12 n=1 Tax=Leptodactylus fuscus TaxID=238119 RepID=UPI003F4F2012
MLGLGSGGAAKAPKQPSFVSYLTPEEIDVKEKVEQAVKVDDVLLLPGEMLLCEASNIFKISQDEGSQRGVCGRLVCTNFKITFLCEEGAEDSFPEFKNKIVGENDITLQCVDQLYAVYDDKKKVLISGAPLKKQPERLIIYCKDFRVFHFCLSYAKEDEVNRIVNGIVHHTLSPKGLKLIFLFSYTEAAPCYKATSVKDMTVLFEKHKDWRMELERTKGNLVYKVLSVNEEYKVSERLPPYFVVPVALQDEYVYKFQGRGIPIWCWSTQQSGALFKMASLPKEVDDSAIQEQKAFLASVENTLHRPPLEEVRIEDLSITLPSLSEIQVAYTRFKQLFLIDNSTDFWDTDSKWFSLLNTSNWLEIVRQCLKKSIEVIEYLENQKINVVLKEDTASDFCCVISSMVQIMMDPHYRTRYGFQSLIQKEWVMGGHQFLDRCNHLRNNNDGEAPVFLLFLDCVWQLVHQYPLAFEFSETYLTVLSDSINIPIFSTFFFNSAYQKDSHRQVEDGSTKQSRLLSFYSVWDWSVQYELKALTFLDNPLYVEKSKQEKIRKGVRSKHHRQLSLPLTQSKSSNKRGFFKEEPGPFIKSLLGKRISKLISASDEVPDNYRVFYENWHRKPIDFNGLILPHIEGPDICIWAQRHLRWIPEAQVLGGGNVAVTQKVLELMDEIKNLSELIERPRLPHPAYKENDVDGKRKKSVRRSSLYPFAQFHINCVRPSISTTTWRSWEAEDELVNRDDEDFDLGTI